MGFWGQQTQRGGSKFRIGCERIYIHLLLLLLLHNIGQFKRQASLSGFLTALAKLMNTSVEQLKATYILMPLVIRNDYDAADDSDVGAGM